MSIPIYYDPMISKLISYGKNREEAIAKMLRAIDEYEIVGVQTTLKFCSFVLKHEAFVSGNFDTHFVKKYFSPDKLQTDDVNEKEIAALLAAYHYNAAKKQAASSSLESDKKSK